MRRVMSTIDPKALLATRGGRRRGSLMVGMEWRRRFAFTRREGRRLIPVGQMSHARQ